MIACYLWRRVGLSEDGLETGKLGEEWVCRVEELLRLHELDPRLQRTDSGFIYWHFHSSGIDETTRLEVQEELKEMLGHLARPNGLTKERDLTIYWDGARSRLEEVSAINQYIQ